jgi:zinc transporter ZupT
LNGLKEPLLGSPKSQPKKLNSPCSIEKRIRPGCDVIGHDEAMQVRSQKLKKEHSHHEHKHEHHQHMHHDGKGDKNLFVHEHDDHYHAHEHYHGGKENIWVTTIGLVIHSLADGTALGATFFCNKSY